MLRALEPLGIDVIFSSELVPPDMMAPAPVAGRTPLQNAEDALAAHGLALNEIAPGHLVVVRIAPAPPPAPDGGSTLEEVSVYASRYSIEGRTVNEPRTLSSSDIDVVPGSHDDSLRALKSLPGLASNVSGRPYIRGSLADDVLVRYDGISLLDPFHLKNFQSLISAIDPATIERIEVFSGGFPVRYGTRSGGVIDITPPTNPVGYENRAAASLISAGVSSMGQAERWPLEWLFALRRSTLDLLDPVEDSIGQPQFGDSLGRLHLRTENGSWTLGWLLLDDRVELNDSDERERADAHYRDEYVWLAHDHEFGPTLRTRATATLTTSDHHRKGTVEDPDLVMGSVDDQSDFERFELTNVWIYQPRDALTFTFGAEAGVASAEYEYARRASFDPGIAAAFTRAPTDDLVFDGRPRVLMYALHASGRRRWRDFEVELGLRFDGEHYHPGGDHTQISPRLNLRYDIDDRSRIYASIGRFSQAQHVEEWRAEEAQAVADSAQVSVHSVVGFTHDSASGTHWSLEAYSKRWTTVSPYFDNQLDPLTLIPDVEPDRIRIAPRRSEASGLELSVHRQFTDRLTARGSLSWSRVADDMGGADVRRSWDQPLALNAGLAWQGGRLNLSAMAGWHRGWPRTPFQLTTSGLTLGQRNVGRWEDFFSIDLRAGYAWRLARGEFSVVLEATNVTNRENECCAVLESDGGGALVSSVDKWLPAIVNLGFAYRWRNPN